MADDIAIVNLRRENASLLRQLSVSQLKIIINDTEKQTSMQIQGTRHNPLRSIASKMNLAFAPISEFRPATRKPRPTTPSDKKVLWKPKLQQHVVNKQDSHSEPARSVAMLVPSET